LAREVEVLRRCTDWLQRLERGENVVVNLRPDEDFEKESVAFDRPRVVRVLERIVADLDTLQQCVHGELEVTSISKKVSILAQTPGPYGLFLFAPLLDFLCFVFRSKTITI
jgi:hypothetical protein